MPTCDELRQQQQALLGQLQTLNAQQASLQAAIVADMTTAVQADDFGGSVPTVPLTPASIQTRINYLQNLLPGASNALRAAILYEIGLYQTVINEIEEEASLQTQIDQVNAELSTVNQEMVNQDC